MCECGVHTHMFVQVSKGTIGGIRSLELELQAFMSHLMWGLGTELGSSGRAAVFLTTEPPLWLRSYLSVSYQVELQNATIPHDHVHLSANERVTDSLLIMDTLAGVSFAETGKYCKYKVFGKKFKKWSFLGKSTPPPL